MKMTTAGELQKHFKADLILAGENTEGELEWLGTQKEWNQLEANHLDPIEVDYRDFESEHNSLNPDEL